MKVHQSVLTMQAVLVCFITFLLSSSVAFTDDELDTSTEVTILRSTLRPYDAGSIDDDDEDQETVR